MKLLKYVLLIFACACATTGAPVTPPAPATWVDTPMVEAAIICALHHQFGAAAAEKFEGTRVYVRSIPGSVMGLYDPSGDGTISLDASATSALRSALRHEALHVALLFVTGERYGGGTCAFDPRFLAAWEEFMTFFRECRKGDSDE